MSTRPREQFDISVSDLEMIEDALRDQARQLCNVKRTQLEQHEQGEAANAEKIDSQMKAIQTVLGKLHNQKVWFTPKQFVPRG